MNKSTWFYKYRITPSYNWYRSRNLKSTLAKVFFHIGSDLVLNKATYN